MYLALWGNHSLSDKNRRLESAALSFVWTPSVLLVWGNIAVWGRILCGSISDGPQGGELGQEICQIHPRKSPETETDGAGSRKTTKLTKQNRNDRLEVGGRHQTQTLPQKQQNRSGAVNPVKIQHINQIPFQKCDK